MYNWRSSQSPNKLFSIKKKFPTEIINVTYKINAVIYKPDNNKYSELFLNTLTYPVYLFITQEI